MKSILTLLFNFIFMALIYSQHAYIPTVKEGAVWRYYGYSLDYGIPTTYPPDTFAQSVSSLEFYGDTLLPDGFHYKRIRLGDSQFGVTEPCCSFYREDTIEKKMFWHKPSNEVINLYDYSLEVGDTFNYYNTPRLIYEVDSILIWGVWHKKMTLNDLANNHVATWIEGVGRIDWVMSQSATYFSHSDNQFEYLVCYQENSQNFITPYGETGSYGCGFVGLNNNNYNYMNQYTLFISDEKCYATNSFPPNCTYRIYSTEGIELLKGFSSEFLKGVSFNFPDGIYFVSIKYRGGEFNTKVIK